MEFLQRIFLENTLESWIQFVGALLIAFIIVKIAVGPLLGILSKIFKRFLPDAVVADFRKEMLLPIQLVVLFIMIFIGSEALKYPDVLDFEVHSIHLRDILMQLLQTFIAIACTLFFLRVINFVAHIFEIRAAKTETQVDDQIVYFVKDILKLLVFFIAFLVILGGIFDVNVTGLIAGAGVAGLALALAAKDSLENLFGSFTIFIEKPFVVGDFIEIGSVMGTVEKVGFRSTRIRTTDKTFVTLPNRNIINTNLNNFSLRTFRRVRFNIGLTYDTSAETIQAIIAAISAYLDQHPDTNADSTVYFDAFGASSLDVQITYYSTNLTWNDYVATKQAINFKIMEIVANHNADFAFPTQTVHIEQASS